MSSEDPFFVVKEEVQKALHTATDLYQRWCQLQSDKSNSPKEELEWTTNELRNSVRSIEWDLEDLQETISIVEKNQKKFKIQGVELGERKAFIERTKRTLSEMKENISGSQDTGNNVKSQPKQPAERNSLFGESHGNSRSSSNKYTRLENEDNKTGNRFVDETRQQQQLMMEAQEDELDRIGGSVTTLKHVSQQIGGELDEQAVMLDEFSNEMYNTESKMDSVMKKMAKVLHMSNDRRQWIAIGVLLLIMLIVIILFVVL